MGTRAALLLATMGVTAAACGGAEATESTSPRPSDGVSTTITTDAPTTTLGDPSTTVIETTVPSTDAPTTTVAETTTTAFDASSVAPDLTPSVDITTPLGMALTIQAILGRYEYTWDGANGVEIDFSKTRVTMTADEAEDEVALVRAIYTPDVVRNGVPLAEKFIVDKESGEFDGSTRRFYPIVGVELAEATYGPVPGTLIALDLPENATPDMLGANDGLRKSIEAYGDRVKVTSYGLYWQILDDPDATVLTPEASYDAPSPSMAFVLDVVTIDDANGEPRFAGFIQSRVAAVWPDDGVTYDNVSTRSPRTGAIVSPDGRIEAAVL
jgi:hypothetical protein